MHWFIFAHLAVGNIGSNPLPGGNGNEVNGNGNGGNGNGNGGNGNSGYGGK